jgi:hypothetical protein
MIKQCPFRYKRWNPETGRLHSGADNPFSDDHDFAKYCNYGKGPWCKQCQHFNQWQVSNRKWRHQYERIAREKKAPHLWKPVKPMRIVNPIGLL